MKNIAVTGYYGTGSSAVIDFLSEIEGVKYALGIRYEHTNLNCRDGLFDLGAILYSNDTNYYSRDMAINRFYNEMYKQYINDFGWYGSYKKLIGEKYMKAVDEFVGKISEGGGKNSLAHTTGTRFSLFKVALQIAAKIVYKRPISKLGRVYVHDGDPQTYLTATYDEFVQAARKFVNDYLNMCREGDSIMIYDHLLFPEQCGVVEKYFDDDFGLIIVDRDPRDVYLSAKHVWSSNRFGRQIMPMPKGIDAFCKYWDAMHKKMKDNAGDKVLIIQFEDLIYKYEETCKKIMDFCGIDSSLHVKKKTIFQPEKSIKNTQVFNTISGLDAEKKVIENSLGEWLYEFPYKIKSDVSEMFD